MKGGLATVVILDILLASIFSALEAPSARYCMIPCF